MKRERNGIYWFIFTTFIISMAMFYYLFVFVKPVPLTLENHAGFFLWSAFPSLLMMIALKKKRWTGFTIIFLAYISASTSLVFEILTSKAEGIGTLGAVLSYILIMIVSFILALIVEGSLSLIRLIKYRSRT